MSAEYVRRASLDRAGRFLKRYEELRKTIGDEERLIRLFENREPIDRIAPDERFFCGLAPSYAQVQKKLCEDYRILEHMTSALSRGIRRIREKRERDYLIFHYFYRFTHESIAEVMHYSERQIYRVACGARTSLSAALKIPPMAKHLKFCRYRARFHKTPAASLRAAS